MANYDKDHNHMERPDTFIGRMNKTADNMKEEDKDLIVNVASASLIGVAAVVGGLPLVAICGCLWAADKPSPQHLISTGWLPGFNALARYCHNHVASIKQHHVANTTYTHARCTSCRLA